VLLLVGYLVVIGAVFGGYALMGGHFGVLFQPVELLMIGGSALGAFIAGNNGKTIKSTLKELVQAQPAALPGPAGAAL
jgi:chemotaxis protein MotA